MSDVWAWGMGIRNLLRPSPRIVAVMILLLPFCLVLSAVVLMVVVAWQFSCCRWAELKNLLV